MHGSPSDMRDIAAVASPVGGQRRRLLFLRKLMSRRMGAAGVLLVGFVLLVGVAGPLLTGTAAFDIDPANRLQPPSWDHWFGTDDRGRDLFARTVTGARLSLLVAGLTILVAAPVGLAIGCTAAYRGGMVGKGLMRLTDIFLAFPSLILVMALVAALGPSLRNAILAMALVSWPVIARLSYAETLRLRRSDFVAAAWLQGAGSFRIVFRHMVPLCLPVVLVRIMLGISNTILTAAALGFLGLGAQPPAPEWGVMLSEGRRYLVDAWWMIAAPGGAIVLTSVAFNLLGDTVRDALDPRGAR